MSIADVETLEEAAAWGGGKGSGNLNSLSFASFSVEVWGVPDFDGLFLENKHRLDVLS